MTPEIAQLIQYGVLGVVVLLFIFGYIHSKADYERLMAEKDRAVEEKNRAEASREEFIQFYNDKLMPMLSQWQHNVEALLPVMQRFLDDRYRR